MRAAGSSTREPDPQSYRLNSRRFFFAGSPP